VPRFDNLGDWLDWQETLHPDPVDLGLERVAEVGRRLDLLAPGATVITVAGTNGKGSSVAMLDAVYRAAGYRTGVYTSPHLLAYNERIKLDGRPVDDAQLCASFARIDAARDGVSLTYFEFGTLAALDIFRDRQPDIMLLEVGMGGRLDAVNIIDPDVALVTAIGIDHSEWLGNDREAIGREKAGIFRRGRAAVCSDPRPPASLRQTAQRLGADWQALGVHFSFHDDGDHWSWEHGDRCIEALPRPSIPGRHQLENAAGVLTVIDGLQAGYPVSPRAIADGLRAVILAGRCQVLPGRVEQVLDVAHNRESAVQLAGFLSDNPVAGQTWLVLGMLADKEVAAVAESLSAGVDRWCFATLPGERGLSARRLGEQAAVEGQVEYFESVDAALAHAQASAGSGDRIVVTGSFLTVAAALASQV
jgi:dihydrofolate synthase/folylpolyglutamate synthase